jgi:transposase
VISLAPGTKVFLACRPVDLRNGFDGLAAKVQQMIGADPFSGHLFIFRGKRGDYLKRLHWDGTGLCLFARAYPEREESVGGFRRGVEL